MVWWMGFGDDGRRLVGAELRRNGRAYFTIERNCQMMQCLPYRGISFVVSETMETCVVTAIVKKVEQSAASVW